MNKIFLLLFISIITFAYGQNQDFYTEYTLYRNLNGIKSEARGLLYVNNTQSYFSLSPFQMVQDKKQESTMIIVDTDKQCDDSQFFLYDDRREIAQFLLFGDDCENKSFIEETKPNPVWEILDRDVVINNYNTVKAKAFINDRLWTIYYDSRMPVKANPWRFLGVNGLIIKAEDENKEYTFVLSKFPKHISKNSFNKELPFKKSSFLDYKKNAIESYRKDMIKELKKMTSNTEEEIIEILQPYETLEFIEKK